MPQAAFSRSRSALRERRRRLVLVLSLQANGPVRERTRSRATSQHIQANDASTTCRVACTTNVRSPSDATRRRMRPVPMGAVRRSASLNGAIKPRRLHALLSSLDAIGVRLLRDAHGVLTSSLDWGRLDSGRSHHHRRWCRCPWCYAPPSRRAPRDRYGSLTQQD